MGDEVGSGTTMAGTVAWVVAGGGTARQVPTLGRVAALQNSTSIWSKQNRPSPQSSNPNSSVVHSREQSIAPITNSSPVAQTPTVVAQKS